MIPIFVDTLEPPMKADERRLDRLFEKTCYAKEIDEMAAALVESFISHLSSRDDLEKAAVTVAEGIKDYSTGKRGRDTMQSYTV